MLTITFRDATRTRNIGNHVSYKSMPNNKIYHSMNMGCQLTPQCNKLSLFFFSPVIKHMTFTLPMQAYHWKLQSAFERSTFLLALKTKLTIRTFNNGRNKMNNGENGPTTKISTETGLLPFPHSTTTSVCTKMTNNALLLLFYKLLTLHIND